MRVELISHENNKAKFNIFVDYADFNKSVNKVYKRVRGSIQVQGFRKGKAPRKIIESMYGKGIFYEDAIDDLVREVYPDAIDELDLDPIDQPTLDIDEIKDGEDIRLEFEVETRPIPELGDFSQVEVTNVSKEVSDEEVDEVLENEAKKNAIISEIDDRPVKDGDKVNIDYKGFVDEEAFDGGEDQDHELVIGSNTFIDNFEEQIIGKEVGDEFDVNVTFPEDYHSEELKGKDAKFEVKLNSIIEETIPEIDDDFAMDVSEFDTLDEYRKSIREKLEEMKAKEVENAQENEALENLVKISNVEAPKAMVDHQLEHEIENLDGQLKQMGLSLSQYVEYSGQSIDKLKEDLRPEAELKVKVDLVLDALAENGEYEVSEEDLLAEYEELKASYGFADDSDYIDSIRNEETDKFFEKQAIRKKAVKNLMEQVKYVDKKEDEEVEEEEESTEE